MDQSFPNSAVLVDAILMAALFASILGCIASRSKFLPNFLGWLQKSPLVRGLLIAFLFAIGSITSLTKDGLLSIPRHLPTQAVQTISAIEPFYGVVAFSTNGSLRAATSNAVEHTAWRLHGASDTGFWLDAAEPFFMEGTNPVSRVHVSAGGSVSIGSMRRPPVGTALPDGFSGTVLSPLRAALGIAPEANWTNANAQSRFWHDALPNGGRVLTWEDALLDRLSGRRVSFQVELHPTGDFTYRYDFRDALAPPATNFVIGAQGGTNGVNALAVLGTNVLSSVVWRVEDILVTNGIDIVDLLCTNGLLRTPATFELDWRNLAPYGDLALDPDEDGLSSLDEVYRYDTDPLAVDTDGDGIADNVELMTGMNPLNADEDGDGVPDGLTNADWAAHSLWATNSADGVNFSITLNETIPTGATATLVLGSLAIPLREVSSWHFRLPEGETVQGRLFSRGVEVVNLSVSPRNEPTAPLRSGGASPSPRIRDDPRGVLDGNSNAGTFRLAIPKVTICNPDGTPAVSECVHDSEGVREYIVRFEPDDWGLSLDNCTIEGFERIGNGRLQLAVGGNPYDQATGYVRLWKYMDYGIVEDSVVLWRCSMPADEPYPMTLEVGYGMKGDFKRILPRHSTNPPGRPMLPCRLTLTGEVEHPATVYISCPKLRFGTSVNEALVVTLTDTDNICDFVVSGEIASEAMDDAVITVRRDGPSGPICATGAMTVVWVDPITIRTDQNDNFSPDNNSVKKPTPPLLGKQYVTMPGFEPTVCNVIEIKGMVHPASFPFNVYFRRDVLGQFVAYKPPSGSVVTTVNDSSIPRGTPLSDDPVYLDVSVYKPTQSGFIYDLDTPGFKYSVIVSQPIGTMLFTRLNFVEYAFCEVGRCSDDFFWHSRTTLSRGSSQQPDALFFSFRVGHEDDNSAGPGLTTIGLD